jgi:tetratricopeptide (TPR) repeat protein
MSENRDMLEMGALIDDDNTIVDMPVLPTMTEGAASPDEAMLQDYFSLRDLCEQTERKQELAASLVESRRESLVLLREVATLRQDGETDKALEILTRILDRDPGNLRASILRNEILAQLEESSSAEQRTLRAEELFQEAAAKFAAGDLTASMALLERTLRLEPQNRAALELRDGVQGLMAGRAQAALQLARSSLASRNLTRAREQVGLARALFPESPDAAALLSEIESAALRQDPSVPASSSTSVPPQPPSAPAPLPSDTPAGATREMLRRVRGELSKRIESEDRKRGTAGPAGGAPAADGVVEGDQTRIDHADIQEVRRRTLAYLTSEKSKRPDAAEGVQQKHEGLGLLRDSRFSEGLAALRRAAELLGEDSTLRRGIATAEQRLTQAEAAGSPTPSDPIGPPGDATPARRAGPAPAVAGETTRPGPVEAPSVPSFPGLQPSPGASGAASRARSWIVVVGLSAVLLLLLIRFGPSLQIGSDGESEAKTSALAGLSRGDYDEAERAAKRWVTREPANEEAKNLWNRVKETRDQLAAFDVAVKGKAYEKARESLARVEGLNPTDPKLKERWSLLETTFSPQWDDQFMGTGLELWQAPDTWRSGKGALRVRGHGIGVAREKYYDDFELQFNLTFVNGKGAAWILRSAHDSYYLFQLTGPKNADCPNCFAVFRYRNGVREMPLKSLTPTGLDLGKPDDQFTLKVKAAGPLIETSIEVASAAAPEPLTLPAVQDMSLAAGAVGFSTTKEDEEFIVRGFTIVPARRKQ